MIITNVQSRPCPFTISINCLKTVIDWLSNNVFLKKCILMINYGTDASQVVT